MAEAFLKSYPRQIADIRDAVGRGDLGALECAAHSFKDSPSNFCARRTYNAAFELEKAARKVDRAACCHLCSVLEAEMEVLKPELLRLGAVEA